MKILFIENHLVFAKMVQNTFLSTHDTQVVSNRKEALKALESKHFEVALVDYDLDDCKGDQITLKIKTLYPHIKIIAVSSHSKGNNLILKAGADAACRKIDFKSIQTVIDSLFKSL